MAVVMEGLRRKDEVEPATEKAEKEEKEEAFTVEPDTFEFELGNMLAGLEEENPPEKPVHRERPDPLPPGNQRSPDPAAGDLFGLIHSALGTRELIQKMVREAAGSLPLDLAILMTFRRSQPDVVRLEASLMDDRWSFGSGKTCSIRIAAVSEVVRTLRALPIPEQMPRDCRLSALLFKKLAMRSCLLVPLGHSGDTASLMALASKRADVFTQSAPAWSWIAAALGLAFERGAAAAAFTRQKAALDTLEQLNRALSVASFDIEKVLKFALERVRAILNVEAGSLYLREKDQLRIAMAFNNQNRSIPKFRMQIGEGLAGHVAAQGKPKSVNEAGTAERLYRQLDQKTGFVTRSALCAPLIAQKQVIGVLEVLNQSNGGFEVFDEKLLQTICSGIAAVLVHSRKS